MSWEPRVKFPLLRFASPWLDQARGWRGRLGLSAMVTIHALIDNRKKFISPVRYVLLHPLVGNELHIFADDCHALRVKLRAVTVPQKEDEDAPNQL